MRSSLLAVLAVACGGSSANQPHTRTAREIVDAASPAIVRVEAGEDRVGTGFILDQSGLIATNLHVIEGESAIKVKLYKDQGEYSVVSIAGVDRGHDLALMRIKPRTKLPVVKLGDSSVVSAGDRIYAIGNPLGMDYSVSDGLVSQVRQLSAELTILQISAPISEGSSGGPLFNQYGEVIGVTTAIVTDGQNINLAMPSNYLAPMMRKPQQIALADFARDTAALARQHGESSSGGDEDNVEIVRDVPNHSINVLDGCSAHDIQDIVTSIAEAIEIGAPLYNQKTKKGYEACYRVYEGTALRYANTSDAACKGVRAAFGDGLLRANSLESYKEKAWAMRDAFDGLIDVAKRWADVNHATLPVD
jgi:S1-C subfamily serine protease